MVCLIITDGLVRIKQSLASLVSEIMAYSVMINSFALDANVFDVHCEYSTSNIGHIVYSIIALMPNSIGSYRYLKGVVYR